MTFLDAYTSEQCSHPSGREGAREGGREGGRDGGRDGGREGEREGGRERVNHTLYSTFLTLIHCSHTLLIYFVLQVNICLMKEKFLSDFNIALLCWHHKRSHTVTSRLPSVLCGEWMDGGGGGGDYTSAPGFITF